MLDYYTKYDWVAESVMETYREAASLCEFREEMLRKYVPPRKILPKKAQHRIFMAFPDHMRKISVAKITLEDDETGQTLDSLIYLN